MRIVTILAVICPLLLIRCETNSIKPVSPDGASMTVTNNSSQTVASLYIVPNGASLQAEMPELLKGQSLSIGASITIDNLMPIIEATFYAYSYNAAIIDSMQNRYMESGMQYSWSITDDTRQYFVVNASSVYTVTNSSGYNTQSIANYRATHTIHTGFITVTNDYQQGTVTIRLYHSDLPDSIFASYNIGQGQQVFLLYQGQYITLGSDWGIQVVLGNGAVSNINFVGDVSSTTPLQ